MVFKLEMGGVHVSCSSPMWTERLIERGARLVGTRESDEAEDESDGEADPGRSSAAPGRTDP
jgi:hypothetical protein